MPSRITTNLMISEMKTKMKSFDQVKFLIDGYPRNQENLDTWIAATNQPGNEIDLKFVLNLDCSEKTCTERIRNRMINSGREDDNLEFLIKRFETHKKSTVPILEHFEKQGLLRTVDAGFSVDNRVVKRRAASG